MRRLDSLFLPFLSSALLLCLSRGAAADVTVFVGPNASAGDVLVLDERGVSSWPAGLQGIVLLPLECTGRTELTELLPESVRLRLDVPGAARLQLPLGQGSLYRFRRDEFPGGPATFGFFVVDPDGRARDVFEQSGAGPRRNQDPLATYVAVARRGDAILVGTRPDAGGDLIEVDLTTGRSVNRTEDLAPFSFPAQGLALFSTWGVALTASSPLRFSLISFRPPDQTLTDSVGDWPAWTGPDLASSADETTVAVIAGESPSRALVYVFGERGPARRASGTPARLTGAGYLPARADGPTLALSPDGTRVAWRSEGDSGECWLRDVRAPGGVPDLQVTGSEYFLDSLDDTGVIAFLGRDDMIALVGEDGSSGLEQADLFRVHVRPRGELDVTNLSRTGPPGDTAPYDYGRLEAADGLQWLPGHDAWLAFDRGADGGAGTWLRLDARGRAPLELLFAADAPRLLEATSRDLYSNLQSLDPFALPRQVLARVALDGTEAETWPLPGNSALERPTTSAGDAFAAVLETAAGELMTLVESGGAPTVLAAGGAMLIGPTVSFAGERLHVTAGAPGAWAVLSLSRTTNTVLFLGLAQGFVLPGA